MKSKRLFFFAFSVQITFAQGQAEARIPLSVVADDVPELNETVVVTLTDVTMELQDLKNAAVIDQQLSRAVITILSNGSPYGVVGWHLDSRFTQTNESQSKCRKTLLTLKLHK